MSGDLFREAVRSVQRVVDRITVYYDPRQANAGNLARRAGGKGAGIEQQPIPGVDFIVVRSDEEASEEGLLSDIQQLLNNRPPEERVRLRRVESNEGSYWEWTA